MSYYFTFLSLGATLRRELHKIGTGPSNICEIFHCSPTVTLSGAAELGRLGTGNPVHIDGHDFAYNFSVVLPCFQGSLGDFQCDISYEGKVHVHGTVRSGESLGKSPPVICNKRTRRISPTAPFSISFSLPGNVDPYCSKSEISVDGNLKVIVLRAGLPEPCRHYFHHNV